MGRRFVTDVLAGLPWLAVLAVTSWPIALIGLAYVVLASAHLSLVTRPVLRLVPWCVAAAIWAWLLSDLGPPDSEPDWPLTTAVGAVIGTVGFALWRLTARLLRDGPTSAPPWPAP